MNVANYLSLTNVVRGTCTIKFLYYEFGASPDGHLVDKARDKSSHIHYVAQGYVSGPVQGKGNRMFMSDITNLLSTAVYLLS